jgi:hypothetical protein
VGEWNFQEQLQRFPAPYQQEIVDQVFWPTLKNIEANFDALDPTHQQAFADTFWSIVERDSGIGRDALIAAANQIQQGGQVQPQPSGAQSSPSQNSFARQLIDDGYEATHPTVQMAQAFEQQLQQSQAAQRQLEQRLKGFEQATKQQTEAQKAQLEREREAEFKAKQDATWETVLGTVKSTIPKGYEQVAGYVEAQARYSAERDTLAQQHLAGAKTALAQAVAFKRQGTPELAAQAEDRANRAMISYSARVAILTQQSMKAQMDLIAENVALKNGALDGQKGRIDLLTGGAAGNGNGGLEPRRQGESAEEYVARAAAYRRARAAEQEQRYEVFFCTSKGDP